MSFLNELIERSGAVSNACQSWHLWGMSLDFVVNWLKKKKGNQYKKYRPILGYGYFIRKGAFYLERRRESRGWAISSILTSRSYLQKFFFRDNCTRIFIAFYHSPRFISLESSTLVPLATVVVLYFNIWSETLWVINLKLVPDSFKICNFPQVIIRQASVTLITLTMEQLAFSVLDSNLCWHRGGNN